ncbi:MAG: PDZ domain-containing protein [Gemmatimonadetes bacterium]|nr:PDZ domain-containing protein [Gemmatimonadota bacterium]
MKFTSCSLLAATLLVLAGCDRPSRTDAEFAGAPWQTAAGGDQAGFDPGRTPGTSPGHALDPTGDLYAQGGAASTSGGLEAPPDQGPASAQQSIQESRTTAIVRAARNVAPAVVTIAVVRRQRVPQPPFFNPYLLPFRETQGLGSGFIIDAEGTVLTNHHVVDDAIQILVTIPDGRDFPARLVGSDATTDIAVLALEGAAELPVAQLGTSSDLMIGEWTIAIGSPFGGLLSDSEPSVTAGVVSALGRHIIPSTTEESAHLGMIQTDAAINPGNSGGPLVNALGQVIGINASILSRSGGSEGLGFAIPIDRALRIAGDLLRYGEVRRAWLGMDVNAVEADNFGRSRGVRVARVVPGSPAAEAGIRTGSRLVRADGRFMATPLDYDAVLLGMRAGDRIELQFEGREPFVVEAVALPWVSAEPVELLRDLEVVTVTPAIQAERGLVSAEGALIVRISPRVSQVIGLVVGDVLFALNNTRLRNARDAANALRRTQQNGQGFVLGYERAGRVEWTRLLTW